METHINSPEQFDQIITEIKTDEKLPETENWVVTQNGGYYAISPN